MTDLSPLRPREFFDRVWSGDGEWKPRPWVAWFPGPRRLHFWTSTTWLSDELWFVHDTTRWEDGTIDRRDFVAMLTAPHRIRLTGPEMPGGCEIELASDGYTFSPYLIQTTLRLVPVPILLRCRDACRLERTGELVDSIDISVAGVPIGRQVMRLRPADRGDGDRTRDLRLERPAS